MDARTKKSFKDSPTWYAYTGQDGAGDKTFAPGVVVPALIVEKIMMNFANAKGPQRIRLEAPITGEFIQSDYEVYYDATEYDIKKGDEILTSDGRFPVKGRSRYPVMKKGEHKLGVVYL